MREVKGVERKEVGRNKVRWIKVNKNYLICKDHKVGKCIHYLDEVDYCLLRHFEYDEKIGVRDDADLVCLDYCPEKVKIE